MHTPPIGLLNLLSFSSFIPSFQVSLFVYISSTTHFTTLFILFRMYYSPLTFRLLLLLYIYSCNPSHFHSYSCVSPHSIFLFIVCSFFSYTPLNVLLVILRIFSFSILCTFLLISSSSCTLLLLYSSSYTPPRILLSFYTPTLILFSTYTHLLLL